MRTITAIAASALLIAGSGVAFAQSNGNALPGKTGPVGNSSQRIINSNSNGHGAQLYVSPAVVRQIKQGLNEAGYNAGQVNGNWDKKAETAMLHFQQAQGLEPTGHINLSSLSLLGVNVQAFAAGNRPGATGATGNGSQRTTTGSIRANGANNGTTGSIGSGNANSGANGGSPASGSGTLYNNNNNGNQ